MLGACLGFFGKGGLKVAGLTLNVLALIPAIAVVVLGITGAGLGALGVGSGKGANADRRTEVPTTYDPASLVSSTKLFEEFRDNEVTADAKYTNKTIQIEFLCQRIGKSGDGRYFIGGPYHGEILPEDRHPNIICFFNTESAKALSDLKTEGLGQRVVISGTCKGKRRDVAAKPPAQIGFADSTLLKVVWTDDGLRKDRVKK
jgi:hypothetical protein